MSQETSRRGYLISEEAELRAQQTAQAAECLAVLAEGGQPTAEQWAAALHVLAQRGEETVASAEFVQLDSEAVEDEKS